MYAGFIQDIFFESVCAVMLNVQQYAVYPLSQQFSTKNIVLHSFNHLGISKAPPEFSKEVVDEVIERLERTGFMVMTTPFGYFNEFKMHVAGDSLAKVWQLSPNLNRLRRRHTISLTDFDFCDDCPYIPYCTGNCPGLAYTLTE